MLHEAINGLIRGYEPDDTHDKVRMHKKQFGRASACEAGARACVCNSMYANGRIDYYSVYECVYVCVCLCV